MVIILYILRVFSYGYNVHEKGHCNYEHQEELNWEEFFRVCFPLEFDNSLDRFYFKYIFVLVSQVQDELSYTPFIINTILNSLRHLRLMSHLNLLNQLRLLKLLRHLKHLRILKQLRFLELFFVVLIHHGHICPLHLHQIDYIVFYGVLLALDFKGTLRIYPQYFPASAPAFYFIILFETFVWLLSHCCKNNHGWHRGGRKRTRWLWIWFNPWARGRLVRDRRLRGRRRYEILANSRIGWDFWASTVIGIRGWRWGGRRRGGRGRWSFFVEDIHLVHLA